MKTNQIINNNKIVSYQFQRRENFLKNIYNKRLDKIDELSKTIDYGDLKFTVNSTGLETNFSELKDPVAFLDSIKKREILIETKRIQQIFKQNKN